MDEVAALVGDVLMEFAVLLDSFLIIFGTGLHPAEPLLELRQLFLGGFQPVGRIGQFTAVRHIEVAHGIFQTNSGLRDRDNRLRLLHDVLIKDVGKIFARFGFSTVTRFSFQPFRGRRENLARMIPALVMRMPSLV